MFDTIRRVNEDRHVEREAVDEIKLWMIVTYDYVIPIIMGSLYYMYNVYVYYMYIYVYKVKSYYLIIKR